MNDNIKILSNYRRLKCIRRANNFPTIKTEDVAEHSYYVAITALTLAEEYNRYATQHNSKVHPLDYENCMDLVNVEKLLKQALFHDMEECFTSDIPYNVKHYNADINAELKRCTLNMLDKIYRNAGINVFSHLYYIDNCKEGLEGAFVSLSDLIEGAWYCYEELDMGNKSIRSLFFNYIHEIENLELIDMFLKTCPTVEALLGLFKDKLTSEPFPRKETELFA